MSVQVLLASSAMSDIVDGLLRYLDGVRGGRFWILTERRAGTGADSIAPALTSPAAPELLPTPRHSMPLEVIACEGALKAQLDTAPLHEQCARCRGPSSVEAVLIAGISASAITGKVSLPWMAPRQVSL